ncbi:MAG: DNA gyrase inhibitor YacG [Pseudomonadota bacterium]
MAPRRQKTRPACPACGKPSDPQTRPFCSKRCRDLDLARWLNGAYAIPVVESEPDDLNDLPPEDH